MADEDTSRNSKDSGASGGFSRNKERNAKSPVDDSNKSPRTSGSSDKPVSNVYGQVVDRHNGISPNDQRFSKDGGGTDRSRDKKPMYPTENPRSPRETPGGKNDLMGRVRRSNESDREGSVGFEVDVVEPVDVEESKTASNNWGNVQASDKTKPLPKPDMGQGSKVVQDNRGSKDSEDAKNKAEDKHHQHSLDDKKEHVTWGTVNIKENTGQSDTDVSAPAGDGVTQIPKGKGMHDVLQFIPPHAIKTVILKSKTRQMRLNDKPNDDAPKPPGPIASKVVYLKKPEPPKEEEPHEAPEPGLPQPEPTQLDEPPKPPVDDEGDNDDKDIEKKLNELIATYRGDKLRKLKRDAKARAPNYKFGDMIKTLNKLGIPCPTNEDFARLHGLHSRWDPDGNIIEYFSPMLRTFIPVNMRGRYRGCWPTDDCMKGLNISKINPKRDALEGFVERGRHGRITYYIETTFKLKATEILTGLIHERVPFTDNIQQKYDDMSPLGEDVAHLDFLVELQAYQAETLPIPIFYDVLHMGLEVANETLRILVQEEGYPPNNYIFSSALTHAEQIRRKIQLYAALGLESMESKRKGLGAYLPQWLKSRDEIIRDSMKSKDGKRYQNFEKMEKEGRDRENRRRSQMFARKSAESPSPRVSNLPNIMRKMSGKFNKVEPEGGKLKKKSFA